MHQTVNAQMALTALSLFSEQVALESLVPAYFASTGYSERFLST